MYDTILYMRGNAEIENNPTNNLFSPLMYLLFTICLRKFLIITLEGRKLETIDGETVYEKRSCTF